MKPFVTHLSSDVLRRSVIVVVGSREATRPLFLKAFKGYEVTQAELRKTWDKLCERATATSEEYPQWRGLTTAFDGDVYIVLPWWQRAVFVHEAYHATRAILRELGTDDEELGAYVLEWIYEGICGRDRPVRRKESKKK